MTRADLGGVPTVTATEMAEIDRIMIEDLGINLYQMMENAGRMLATLVIARYHPRRVTVVAGSGGNGGGGRAAARHLFNRGVGVDVVETKPLHGVETVPGAQAAVLERLGVPVSAEIGPTDVLIDAIIGYSLQGAPTGRAGDLVETVNGSTAPVVSLDVPSGLDTETGEYTAVHVVADMTLTLALPKVGMTEPGAGNVVLADISVPSSAFATIGVDVPDGLFAAGPLRFLT